MCITKSRLEQICFIKSMKQKMNISLNGLSKKIDCNLSTLKNYSNCSRKMPEKIRERILNVSENKFLDSFGVSV